MSEILVKYVVDTTPEQLLALSLEDLALCQAWYASYLDAPDVRAMYDGLPGKVAAWTSDSQDSGYDTQGARQQPVLRHVLGRLEASSHELLTRDELDFLFHVYELIQRTKHRNVFQRPTALIAPHLAEIRRLRETMKPVRGLPEVLKRVGVATEASILQAPRRTIGSFGGLPLEFRGPVLRHGGYLKVVGDVPDSTAVVVEGAGCYVSGYVLGRLLVGGHVEVRENIAGTVIAERGNIRARGIINRATAIAKRGRVRVGSSQDPDLVYAGTQIRIEETARLGRYIAPRMRVGALLHGGECHVAGLLRAGAFSHPDNGSLNIVLRAEVGCEDYGEVLTRDARRLIRSAKQLRNRVEHLHQMMNVQREEAEHYASTALLYMCSGHNSQEELQRADSLKRRRAFLIRMLTGVHLITRSLSERLRDFQKDGKSSPVAAERSIQSVLGAVSKELAQLKVEGEFPEELDKAWAELMSLHETSARGNSEGVISHAILRFHDARKAWRSELDKLDGRIKALREELGRDGTRKSLLERAQADGTSQPALAQLIRAARDKGAGDPVMRRVTTPFIKRMLTLMQKRNQWVERYHKEAGEVRADLVGVQERLLDEFNVRMDSQPGEATVVGCFDAGVCLYAGEIHPVDVGEARETALRTPDSQGETWTYRLVDDQIVRVAET